MPIIIGQKRSSAWRTVLLRHIVHFEALLLDPVRYLRCFWWWITGKRLRARLGLAPLLGRAEHAYALWQLRHEPLMAFHEPTIRPRIIALVENGADTAATLASLVSEEIEALVVNETLDIGSIKGQHDTWLMPLACGDLLASGAGPRYRAAAAAV